jgi:hypothetical protein
MEPCTNETFAEHESNFCLLAPPPKHRVSASLAAQNINKLSHCIFINPFALVCASFTASHLWSFEGEEEEESESLGTALDRIAWRPRRASKLYCLDEAFKINASLSRLDHYIIQSPHRFDLTVNVF